MLTASLTARSCKPCRIVIVSSTAHNFGKMDFQDLHYRNRKYSEWPAYGQSKLANLLHTKGLNDRLQGSLVTAVCLHPGVIATPLWRESGSFLKNLVMPFIADKTVFQVGPSFGVPPPASLLQHPSFIVPPPA